MRTFYIAVLLLFFGVNLFANRAKIRINEELAIKKTENLNSSDVADKWVRHNKMLDIMRQKFPSFVENIAYQIGNNSRLEIDQNTPNSLKNFDLNFNFSCISDETTEPLADGPHAGTVAKYSFFLHIELFDPNTQYIVGSYSINQVYLSHSLLSGEEQSEYAQKLFSDPTFPNIDKLEADILRMANYRKATIQYAGNQIADGQNKGEIKVSGIVHKLIGEAKNNPISAYELRCEKGKFLKTNSKKVRFEGNEYFHQHNQSMPFIYQTYNCGDYEDNESDIFTLVQISRFNEKIDEKIIQTEEIRFNCSTYNVHAHYYCNGFADAEVVWENVKIVIPDDKSKIKVYDAATIENDELSKIAAPYAINIPGYGMEYYFSECENPAETPKVIKMKSLIDEGVCFLETADDALNSLSIEMTPEQPNVVKLVLQFDMFIGESRENSQQMTVGTDSEFEGGTEFLWRKIDDDIILKLQNGEYAQKTLTNSGGCKLVITFKPN